MKWNYLINVSWVTGSPGSGSGGGDGDGECCTPAEESESDLGSCQSFCCTFTILKTMI